MEIDSILIWHQGALGDLLLAGPALAALSRHYAGARFTALGKPEPLGLLARSLPLKEVWDSGEARWGSLFGAGSLPAAIQARLARFQLALVFSPRAQTDLLDKLQEAGIPRVHWLPSFSETEVEAVAVLQARHLAALGLHYEPAPFRLEVGLAPDEDLPELPGFGPWLAAAPGSGHPLKNWPLAHYYEVSRALSWEYGLGVVWLAGPAEEGIRPYLEALAEAQGQTLLVNRPLVRVAQVLSRCRLYLGNDSGLTHLAAAVAGPEVLALFGPTDPRVWAPLGPQVQTLTAPCSRAPCTSGRAITCLEPDCMRGLSRETVMAAAAKLLGSE
ncbi:MAG TPA: glycosyltransferase family 9 protein [Desulfobaccales bacterium]|nr:glycosyltransferase family 9 protein [Desulfobaccales bacterium]